MGRSCTTVPWTHSSRRQWESLGAGRLHLLQGAFLREPVLRERLRREQSTGSDGQHALTQCFPTHVGCSAMSDGGVAAHEGQDLTRIGLGLQ